MSERRAAALPDVEASADVLACAFFDDPGFAVIEADPEHCVPVYGLVPPASYGTG